jgi:hypothetical protein
MHMNRPTDRDPRETPNDDPRQQTDWPSHKQTNKPWKGNPEKEQLDPNRPDIDLEKWQQSDTHQTVECLGPLVAAAARSSMATPRFDAVLAAT